MVTSRSLRERAIRKPWFIIKKILFAIAEFRFMIRFLQKQGRAQKIILGGILAIVCVMMVITLVPGGILSDTLGGGTAGVVAKVAGQDVTINEVQTLARQMGRQQFPRGLPPQFLPFFVKRAADSLILQRALQNEAGRIGFRVSNDELREELQHGPLAASLFPKGNFIGQDEYENFVAQNLNMSVGQFEQTQKTYLLTRKLINAVEGAVTVSDAEVEQELRRQNTKVKFDYAVLTTDDIMKQLKPTEAELKSYLEKNKQTYANAIPEKRSARYILIENSKLEGQAKVTPDDIRRYYDQHREEYRLPEQVNVRHILIKTPAPGPDGKVDEKSVQAARTKAEDILKKLKAGAKFEDLAKKFSEDPGSAKNGGSLGMISRGRTVPEFEKAAFSLPKGQLSDIIQTSYGFHILRVDDKQEARLKPLDEVKSSIEPVLAQEKSARAAETLANSVQADARTKGLEKAAADHGLQLVTTKPFSRSDTLPGLGNSPELMEAVFNARANSPPEAVRTAQGYAVFQVTEIKPPATPTFDEIRARVENDFKSERAAFLLSKKTQELADRARAQHNLKKAAKEIGATVKTSELVTPESQVPDVGQMSGPASVVFSMKPGDISGAISSGSSGLVLALVQKQEPTAADTAKSREQVRENLLQKRRSDRLELFVENLRQRMEKEGKIRINQQEMSRIAGAQGGS